MGSTAFPPIPGQKAPTHTSGQGVSREGHLADMNAATQSALSGNASFTHITFIRFALGDRDTAFLSVCLPFAEGPEQPPSLSLV